MNLRKTLTNLTLDATKSNFFLAYCRSRPAVWVIVPTHYNDVIMSAIAFQITSLTTVYSTVYSGADERKHQSSASLGFVRNSPVTGEFLAQMGSNAEMFPFDDVIMIGPSASKFVWSPVLSTSQISVNVLSTTMVRDINLCIIVRRAGLLWSQQDFEWRWSVPLFKCLTVLEFSFILFDLCLLITFFNFIMNYVPIVTFWIFTYHKIWILSIMFCFIWSYWIIYFLACLEVSWRVVS